MRAESVAKKLTVKVYQLPETIRNAKPAQMDCRNEDTGEVLNAISDPLTVIKGYLQFFEKSSAERDQAWLTEVFREIEHIEAILKSRTTDPKPGSSL